MIKETVALLIPLAIAGCASGNHPLPRTTDNAERAALIAVVDEMFDGLRTRDQEIWNRVMRQDAVWHIQRVDETGAATLSTTTTPERIEALGRDTNVADETYSAPTVLIHGPLAVFWAPYQVAVDGEVAQCGVNAFQMLKIDGAWTVGNISYTAEPCAVPDE